MINLSTVKLEFKKLGLQRLFGIAVLSCIVPFVFTLFIVFTQSSGISKLDSSFIIDNLVGPWSSLLLGLLVVVLGYVATEEEQQKNILKLYRSYKSNWYGWIFRKSLVIIIVLLFVFIINLLLTSVIVKIIEGMIASSEGFPSMYKRFFVKITKAYVFVLPGLFFQLLLTVLIRKSIFPVILGLLIMILGIPIANLSNSYLIPYSYPILSQKPSMDFTVLSITSILVIVVCVVMMNRALVSLKK